MKVVIAGIRYKDPENKIIYDDYAFVAKCINQSKFDITDVVCGKAIGVDTLGEQWAILNDIPVEPFPADWNTHKKAAGPIRNMKMAEYSDAAIIIWDGKSSGTYNMIQNMIKLCKPYELYITSTNIEDFFI